FDLVSCKLIACDLAYVDNHLRFGINKEKECDEGEEQEFRAEGIFDYRMTKDCCQHYEGEDRHAENQDECVPAMQYPTPFPAGNQHEPRPGPRLHGLPRRP